MSLSTTCPGCSHLQDLSRADWRGISYETECESCGFEIVGFLVQQTVNWPSLREHTYRPRVYPIETAAQHPSYTNRASYANRAVQFVDAAMVWLKAPMSQDLSRLSWWLRSAW